MNIFDFIKPYGRRMSLEDLGLYLNPVDTPPRNSTLIDQKNDGVVPPGIPGTPGSLLLFQYQVPVYRRGILRRLAVDSLDPAGLPSLRYSILRSGDPVPNYQSVELPCGTVGTPDDVYVQYDREQLLQVVAFNTSLVSPFDVAVRVVAWFWDDIQDAGR